MNVLSIIQIFGNHQVVKAEEARLNLLTEALKAECDSMYEDGVDPYPDPNHYVDKQAGHHDEDTELDYAPVRARIMRKQALLEKMMRAASEALEALQFLERFEDREEGPA